MSQQITTTSWGKRFLNALFGIIIGIIMIPCAIYLVFWNEGHGLHTAQSLEQTKAVLIPVASSPIDAANNMRVVYFSGEATTKDILRDDMFNIAVNAIQLKRDVKMYQWQEEKSSHTEKNLGGSESEVTTYNYHQTWSSNLIDSSQFNEQTGHQNPASMPIESNTEYAKHVTVGDFKLPQDLIEQISGNTKVNLDKVDLSTLKEKLKKPVQLYGEGIYAGNNVSQPQIGDLRINFTMVIPQVVSVIAQQTGDSLQPYMAPAGIGISLLEMGQVSSDQMIHNAEVSNMIMMWVLRGMALLLMIIGFALILKPLSVAADVIPFMGNLVEFGTGLVALIAGLIIWSISVAVAWFAVRPLMSIGLLIVIGAICYLLYARRKRAQTT